MSTPKPLSSLIAPLTKDVMGKKGALFGRLLMEWAAIVGEETARRAVPAELKPVKSHDKNPRQAALHLAVSGSHALEIQHEIPYLLERINGFFGYQAITAIKLVQQPVTSQTKARRKVLPPLLPIILPPEFEKIIASTPGNDLQEALRNLGKTLSSQKKK